MKEKENVKEFDEIDVGHVLKHILQKFWIVAIVAVLAAAMAFSIAAFAIQPEYSSAVMLYVNNSDFSLGNTSFSISSSDISASRSLLNTYIVLLKNRTTLEEIIERAQLPYTWRELSGMIAATSVDGTEVMRVTVTCNDPYEAAEIANTVARVLPERISEIIDGAAVVVVDDAVPNLNKVSPSITRYTAIGFIIGAVIAVAAIAVIALFDKSIHSEEYLLKTYDYPILARIPNLLDTKTKEEGYYASPYETDTNDKQEKK